MSFARPILKSSRQVDIVAAVGQVAFAFPLPLFDTADLVVLIQVAPSPLFQPVTNGFTVTLDTAGTPTFDNATVTFAAPPVPAQGSPAVTIRLAGRRVQDRLYNVTRGGTLNSAATEDELDRQAIILQELRRDVDLAVFQSGLALAAAAVIVAPVSNWQIRNALALRGEIAAVAQAIPALATGDANAIAWASRDALFAPGDSFLTWLAVTLGDTALVTEARLALAASAALTPGVSALAIRTALAVRGLLLTVEQAIPADPADPANVEWTAATSYSPLGPVAGVVAAVAGFDPVALLAMQQTAAALAMSAPASGFATLRQLRAALAVLGQLGAVEAALPAEAGPELAFVPGELAKLQWDAGTIATPGDPLMTAIATACGFNTAQQAALISYATEISFS